MKIRQMDYKSLKKKSATEVLDLFIFDQYLIPVNH